MKPSGGMEGLGITALVSVGGDGSLTIAQQMHEAGIADSGRAQDD